MNTITFAWSTVHFAKETVSILSYSFLWQGLCPVLEHNFDLVTATYAPCTSQRHNRSYTLQNLRWRDNLRLCGFMCSAPVWWSWKHCGKFSWLYLSLGASWIKLLRVVHAKGRSLHNWKIEILVIWISYPSVLLAYCFIRLFHLVLITIVLSYIH